MSEVIKTPVFIEHENNSRACCIVGADTELILSTSDASNEEMQEIMQALNGKAAATKFMQELLDSVETLYGIAEQHGVQTLTDLMYLQNAILNGDHIENISGISEVLSIAKSLPSGKQWTSFIQ